MVLYSISCLNFYIAFFAVFLVCIYFYATYKHNYWKRRGVKSLPTHMIFGNFKDIFYHRETIRTALDRLHLESDHNEPCVGIYVLHKPILLLTDLEVIKIILIKDFHLFQNRHITTNFENDIIANSNLFSVKNPRWKFLRTKLSPVFSTGKQKKLFQLMLYSAENMKKHFETIFKDDNVVTLKAKEICRKYIIDVIASLSFGIQMNSFTIPVSEFYKHSVTCINLDILRSIHFFIVIFFPNIGNYLNTTFLGRYKKFFQTIFWESMNKREKCNIKRGDAIDYLLNIKNDEQSKKFKIEGDVLLAQSIIFLFAGLESSATTIMLTLLELAKNVSIQTKLREEIIEKLKKDDMTYESIQEMKYLQQCILETLRHYPPVFILDRIAESDYQIPGTKIIIEKGTPVYISLSGIHKDPRFHPNPEKYDPDRFSDEKKDDIFSCSFMPFGQGPRRCIGARLGILQTAVGLVTIIRNYEVALNSNYENESSSKDFFFQFNDVFNLDFKKVL